MRDWIIIDVSRDVKRFWAKVDLGAPDDCWEWAGWCNSDGYGAITLAGKNTLAHRHALFLASGDRAVGLEVCHSCDNRPCCNPKHLFKGTRKQNAHDAMRKGRLARGDRNGMVVHPESVQRGNRHWSRVRPHKTTRGERHGRAVLTEKQALAIKRSSGLIRVIAARYGVSKSLVGMIRAGKVWKHLK